jgi:hypothetical protein
MAQSRLILRVLLLCLVGALPASSDPVVTVHPSVRLSEDEGEKLRAHLPERLTEAQAFLAKETDYRPGAIHEGLRVTIRRFREPDGRVIPACYTFPDSMIRLVPEYAFPLDEELTKHILETYIDLGEPLDEVLSPCTPAERAAIPEILDDFILSELIHEVYHDWQNRVARFPTVEQGKTLLGLAGESIGIDWKSYLREKGLDLDRHDRQLAEAEEQSCIIQAFFWKKRHGEDPTHPLAASFLRLMEGAIEHYHLQRTR